MGSVVGNNLGPRTDGTIGTNPLRPERSGPAPDAIRNNASSSGSMNGGLNKGNGVSLSNENLPWLPQGRISSLNTNGH